MKSLIMAIDLIPKKVYISGQITGLSTSEVTAKFKAAEDELIKHHFTPVNPLTVSPYHPSKTWDDYMVDDILAMLECDAIYPLENWKESRGAKVEILLFKLIKGHFAPLDEMVMGTFLLSEQTVKDAYHVLTLVNEKIKKNYTYYQIIQVQLIFLEKLSKS